MAMSTPRRRVRKAPPTKRFPFDDKYDFSYKPDTYWPQLPSEQTLLSTIEGTARRDIARRALEGEKLPRLSGDELYREAMEFVLEEKLEEAERDSWGAFHPGRPSAARSRSTGCPTLSGSRVHAAFSGVTCSSRARSATAVSSSGSCTGASER
jgi:hypothetical protein